MSRKFLALDSSSAMVFDGSLADTWSVQLVGSVLSARTRLISPGRLYTFIIIQGATTTHQFNFPITCRNAAPMTPEPGTMLIQNFIGDTGGWLYSNIPAAYMPYPS
jgi:hypothetical protein